MATLSDAMAQAQAETKSEPITASTKSATGLDFSTINDWFNKIRFPWNKEPQPAVPTQPILPSGFILPDTTTRDELAKTCATGSKIEAAKAEMYSDVRTRLADNKMSAYDMAALLSARGIDVATVFPDMTLPLEKAKADDPYAKVYDLDDPEQKAALQALVSEKFSETESAEVLPVNKYAATGISIGDLLSGTQSVDTVMSDILSFRGIKTAVLQLDKDIASANYESYRLENLSKDLEGDSVSIATLREAGSYAKQPGVSERVALYEISMNHEVHSVSVPNNAGAYLKRTGTDHQTTIAAIGTVSDVSAEISLSENGKEVELPTLSPVRPNVPGFPGLIPNDNIRPAYEFFSSDTDTSKDDSGLSL